MGTTPQRRQPSDTSVSRPLAKRTIVRPHATEFSEGCDHVRVVVDDETHLSRCKMAGPNNVAKYARAANLWSVNSPTAPALYRRETE